MVAAAGAFAAALAAHAEPMKPYTAMYLTPCKAISYKDPATGVVFNTDGRFLVATAPDGHRLWRRDPHENVSAYRTKSPCIAGLGAAQDWQVHGWRGHHIGLAFNNSQFGVVDVSTGAFTFMGQD